MYAFIVKSPGRDDIGSVRRHRPIQGIRETIIGSYRCIVDKKFHIINRPICIHCISSNGYQLRSPKILMMIRVGHINHWSAQIFVIDQIRDGTVRWIPNVQICWWSKPIRVEYFSNRSGIIRIDGPDLNRIALYNDPMKRIKTSCIPCP